MSALLSRRDLLRGSLVIGAAAAAGVGLAGPALAATPSKARPDDPAVVLGWFTQVFEAVRVERASPTSAARIYALVAIAAYEGAAASAPGMRSLGGQLNELGPLPRATAKGTTDRRAAANAAIGRVVQAAFADRSEATRQRLADHAAAVHAQLQADGGDPAAVARGARFGRSVGDALASWIAGDGYAESRGLPYTPPEGPAFWIRTPPNFGAAIEPHWAMVRPLAMTSGDEVKPKPHVKYSEKPGSPFHRQAMAVVDASKVLTDAQRETALYWRDNPDGTTSLPSGHWMQIAARQAEQRDLVGACELLALVGICIAEGFTSCWVEKYKTNLLRPVTYIQRVIDPTWQSFVNSPAFPEYTSGHSVGSGAAAHALTTLVGAVPFTDVDAAGRGFVPRRYASFDEAADEAAISRLYGGIHYPMGIKEGVPQGRAVAATVLGRVSTRR